MHFLRSTTIAQRGSFSGFFFAASALSGKRPVAATVAATAPPAFIRSRRDMESFLLMITSFFD
jgi:hypothetical protein